MLRIVSLGDGDAGLVQGACPTQQLSVIVVKLPARPRCLSEEGDALCAQLGCADGASLGGTLGALLGAMLGADDGASEGEPTAEAYAATTDIAADGFRRQEVLKLFDQIGMAFEEGLDLLPDRLSGTLVLLIRV